MWGMQSIEVIRDPPDAFFVESVIVHTACILRILLLSNTTVRSDLIADVQVCDHHSARAAGAHPGTVYTVLVDRGRLS